MKAAASILLLALSSSIFYYGYFDIMLFESKEKAAHSFAAAAKDHSLKLIKFPLQLAKNYNDDELTIDGKLYDVGERETTNDTLYLSLYHDTDEEDVLSSISDFFKSDDSSVYSCSNIPSFKSAKAIFNPFFYLDKVHKNIFKRVSIHPFFYNQSVSISSISFDIITPPPRLS